MKTQLNTPPECSLARSLAPEDVRRGQYVSILDEIVEIPAFLTCTLGSDRQPDELLRVKLKSSEAGLPLRVKAVCLPFVAVLTPRQQTQLIDLRKVQLVCVSREYGKAVWKALQKEGAAPQFPLLP